MIGGIAILLLVFGAVAAPLLAQYGPTDINFESRFQGPSAEHWFGTDQIGRDLFARVLYGARISVVVGLLSVTAAALIGGLSGAVAGYYAGWAGGAMMRFWDALFAIPMMLVGIGTVAVLGTSLRSVGVAIAIGLSAYFARITRGAVVQELAYDYVDALRGLGISNPRVMFRHVLPNAMAPVIVQASILLGATIIFEASLSFLGAGAKPTDPSWGAMISGNAGSGVNAIHDYEQFPWLAITPAVLISLSVLSFNLLGDAVRDVLDPRLRGGGGRLR